MTGSSQNTPIWKSFLHFVLLNWVGFPACYDSRRGPNPDVELTYQDGGTTGFWDEAKDFWKADTGRAEGWTRSGRDAAQQDG